MGGTAVFYGTRVPVQTLLDYLEAGETIDDFLEGFPSVTRAQVIAFLEAAKDRLVESVSCKSRRRFAYRGDHAEDRVRPALHYCCCNSAAVFITHSLLAPECRLWISIPIRLSAGSFARGSQRDFAFAAAGSRQYVAGATLGAAVGYGIASAIEQIRTSTTA